MLRVKVEREEQSGTDGPILCSFPHGFPNEDLDIRLLANLVEKKTYQRALVAETELVNYIGTNFGVENTQGSGCTHYGVGVFNRKKQKISYVDVNHLYMMHQELRNLETSKDDDNRDYYTQRNRVVDAFGSKKRKKQLKSQLANRVNLDASASAVEAVSDVIGNLPEHDVDETSAQSALGVLPEHDLETKKINEIYPIKGFFPKYAQSTFSEGALFQLADSDSSIVEGSHPLCVAESLTTVRALDDKKLRLEKTRLLCYLELLVTMAKTKAKEMKAVVDGFDCAEEVKRLLRTQFFEAEGKFLESAPMSTYYFLLVFL
jgi:hypothetical protein